MGRQTWLHYYSYESYDPYGSYKVFDYLDLNEQVNEGFIDRNTDSHVVEKLQLETDRVLLVVGISPKQIDDAFNFPESWKQSLREYKCRQKNNGKIYFIGYKLTPLDYKRNPSGGWRYCVQMSGQALDPLIMLESQEFREFWANYKRHVWVDISKKRNCPFPELEEIGEGFVFQPQPKRPGRIPPVDPERIPDSVKRGVAFLRNTGFQRNNFSIPQMVCHQLKTYGYQQAAAWIQEHLQDYLVWARDGFH
jgi:hypothetical protein